MLIISCDGVSWARWYTYILYLLIWKATSKVYVFKFIDDVGIETDIVYLVVRNSANYSIDAKLVSIEIRTFNFIWPDVVYNSITNIPRYENFQASLYCGNFDSKLKYIISNLMYSNCVFCIAHVRTRLRMSYGNCIIVLSLERKFHTIAFKWKL